MSNSATVLTIGGVLVVGGGIGAWWYMRKKKKDAEAAAASTRGPGSAGPAAAGQTKKMGVAEALATHGGKAVQEGIKYLVMGPTAYGASTATKSQKAA
jgi:LPXTG-motif cell wall-anchored protein